MRAKKHWLLVLFLCFQCLCPQGLASEAIEWLDYPGDALPLAQPGVLEVHFINVASADCILLRMDGETMLVDGGLYCNYERITAYLDSLGITSLDYVFATHPHDDHIGGLRGVMAEIPVGAFCRPRLYEDYASSDLSKLRKVVEEKQIATQYIENETTMTLGGARLTFYQWQNPRAYENNKSMAVHVSLGDRSVLLSADVEHNGQKALAEAHGSALKADILKMPHHGFGSYTRELHAAVAPQLGTISNIRAKVDNVVSQLEARGVDWVLTTKGTIVAVTDGTGWQLWQIPRVPD